MILHCPHCRVKVARDQKHCVTCKRVMIRRCPACAEDISVLAALCKYCGESVVPVRTETVAPAIVAPPPPPAPRPEVEFVGEVRHVAWEDGRAGCSVRKWWSTWAGLMSPAEFWKRAPVEGGHGRPISFAWMPIAQVLTVGLAIGLVGATLMSPSIGFFPGPVFALGALGLLLYPLTFVATAASVWISAALWHLPLKLLGGKGTYEGTVRAVSYNSGVHVWHLVPGLGSIVAFVLWTFLNYHAFRNVHQMGKARASVAAAIPWVVGAAAVTALVIFAEHHGCPIRSIRTMTC